ncbi:MAG: alcohol dehydrogenase family protein [Pseudomonadota bacterium]
MGETMRAMVLTGHGGMDRYAWHTDWPKPVAGPGEALIKVGACGLNNTDVNTRTAWYSKKVTTATDGAGYVETDDTDSTWGGASIRFPRIQGADVCGLVEAVGEGVDSALLGRRVIVDTWLRDWADPLNPARMGYFGSEADGGFAEYTVIDARHVYPVESALSDAELATFATAWITAENMLNRADVGDGDSVLITGASGGVGSALIQLARRRGAATLAVAAGPKIEAVRAIGPKAVIDRALTTDAGALKAAIVEATGQDTVSVVADVVGGGAFATLIDCIRRGGRYTVSGAIAGPMVSLDLRTLYLRDLTFAGATTVPPGIFAHLVGYIERGEVTPLLAASYPLEKLVEAQTAFIEKRHTGNIVVLP